MPIFKKRFYVYFVQGSDQVDQNMSAILTCTVHHMYIVGELPPNNNFQPEGPCTLFTVS